MIEGRIQTRSWDDKTTGEKKYRTEIVADAVQFGDFHTSHDVVHALTGEHRADDARMAQVLQPWMGDRYRVVRLVELTGISAPRRGPRLAPADHRDR